MRVQRRLVACLVATALLLMGMWAAPARADEGELDAAPSEASGAGFSDVPSDHWAYNVVRRAVALGLFSGYSGERAGQFGPEDAVTRGQAVTVLWRMAGKPAAGSGAKAFSDVSEGAYYAAAVAWASSRGVVSGYSGDRASQFGPNDGVTREQLACMLTSYARRVAGLDAKGDPSSYSAMSDASSVSSWAASSMGWCYACGLLSGASGKALPQSGATRAQAAKMLVALSDRATAPWQLSVSPSATEVRVGTTVSWYPLVTGEAGDLSYSYTMALGSWSEGVGDGMRQLSEAGSYLLTVKARDSQSRSQAASCVVNAYELRGLDATYLRGTTWRAVADVGVLGGRVPGVEYRFTYERGGSAGELRGWGTDHACEFDVSAIGGAASALTLVVEGRDAAGSLGTKARTLSVDDLFETRVREVVAGMSTEQKVAQLFVVMPEDLVGGSGYVTTLSPALREALEDVA